MPDMLAHYLVAKGAAEQAGDGGAPLVDRAFDAYKVGAQGPDVFFYSHVLRPRRRTSLASLTHQRHTTAALTSMLEHAANLSGPRRDVAFAFAAGYATHLCLDAEVHPWVMYWTGDITGADDAGETARAFRRHGVLEASLDVLLRGEQSVRTDWLRKRRLLRMPVDHVEVVSELLSDMLSRVYGASFTPAEGRSAFRSMDWIYATMSDPRDVRTRLLAAAAPLSQHRAVVRSQIYPAVPAPTAARLYARRNPWRHPWLPDVERTETFLELSDIATAAAARCLESIAAFAGGDIEVADAVALVGDRSMFTGLPCDDGRRATAFAPDLEQLWGKATA